MPGFESEEIDSYRGMLNGKTLRGLGIALLISLGVVASSFGIGLLFPKDYLTSIVILGVTSLGISMSFVPYIKRLGKTFPFGMYIILIFCLTVGSMASLDQFLNINYDLLFYVLFSVFGSMVLHALFCKLCKIDADTFIITSASAICSPPLFRWWPMP